jgi:glucose/arabinose dehydrogenase
MSFNQASLAQFRQWAASHFRREGIPEAEGDGYALEFPGLEKRLVTSCYNQNPGHTGIIVPPYPHFVFRMTRSQVIVFLALVWLQVLCQGQSPVEDPVPTVESSGIRIWMREFADIPHSSSSRPFARINQVEPFSLKNKWLGVNDLRGPFFMMNYQGTVIEYLDMRDNFPDFDQSPGLGTGFTSFAAHPEFDQNGKFYTSHTEFGGSGTPTIPLPTDVDEVLQGVITEWTASNPGAIPFSGTKREVLRIELTGTIHGFQEIAFHPEIDESHPDYGLLYICIGEAQTLQRGPLSNIGTIESPISTLFRIDPMGTNSRNGQYGIPPDNPFVGTPAAIEEIWAYGFRNPHRIAWNDLNGDLILTDIGERQIEEINIIEPGKNYGWPYREGPFLLDPEGQTNVVFPIPPDDSGYTYPVAMYDHDDGFAIAGGFVYRGPRHPELAGMFLASDIRSGTLWMVPADDLQQGATVPLKRWFMRDQNNYIVQPKLMVGNLNVSSARTDLRIGTDHFGEIYILTKQDAKIRKLVTEGEPQDGLGIFEGYPWANNWVDTGPFLGWANVLHYPWVWLELSGKYIYATPSPSPGGWVYWPK